MSARCQMTGRTPGFGNTVSHSHRRTRRRFAPDIRRKRSRLPSEHRYESAVARMRARGEKI
ncbi:50S ribosomal protein L28 [Streptomyces sp. MAR4 CNX-425]|uniref:50S ribosomal protein L28 n=1 Tax=Streptomyces sp. MAR4 CNX-425 TaxID=3406343 RepID=UPI003B510B98